MDQALALVHAKDLPRAVEALRAILADDPGNYLAAHTLADALFDLSRDGEAIEAYRRALASGRGAAYYHYRLGFLHERRHEYGRAAGEFAQVIQYNPAAARDVLERGDQLLATGSTAGALAYFEMLRAAGSGGPALAVRLADARLRAGQADGAVAELREAIRRDPDVPELRDTLVRALGQAGAARGDAGDLSGATAAFREALTVAPADFDSLANLGLTELRAGRAGAALEALTRALAVRPNEVRLLNVTAEIHFRRREYAAAHDLLTQSLAIDPNQPRIVQALRAVNRAAPNR
jgi:tetratricopeptide (TPR) repeat protein